MATETGDVHLVVDDEKGHHEASTSESFKVAPKSSNPDPRVAENPTQTWRSYIWDSLDKSPEERRFLFKFDALVLTLACLGSFIKYLDQINVNSAFVSGMEVDLGLYNNELNYLATCWTVGYVVGQIPSNLIITRIRPSIWIPSCEVVWTVLTILMVKCTNVTGMYALRFFIGLSESAFNPGMLYLLGSWYRKDELAKRAGIFQASSFVGAMFSGYLMAATYNLNGVNGFKGWQWLFIVNAIISFPVAIAGYFILPDNPENTRARWLTTGDVALARQRMAYEKRATKQPFTRAKFRKTFTSWHIYTLVLLYVLYNNNGNYGGQPGFQLWLKSENYSVQAVNLYPTISLALAVVFAFLFAWSSDSLFRGARWPPIIIGGVANIVINASLAAWDIPLGWKWTCYILGGLPDGLGAIVMAWANEICGGDNEERAFVIAAMNTMGSAVQAWLPLLIWKQVDAPRYAKGFLSMVFIALALNATTMLTWFLQRRERLATEESASDESGEIAEARDVE